MSNKDTAATGGIGLFGFVFLIFLTLKIAGIGDVATWSWWAVTAPLWGPVVAVLAFILVFLFIAFLVELAK